MWKFNYTCRYAVDKTGYRAEKRGDVVGYKTAAGVGYFSSLPVFRSMLAKWTNSSWVYEYFQSGADRIANNAAIRRDYEQVDSCIGYRVLSAWLTRDTMIHIKLKET